MARRLSNTRLVVASHNPGKVREISELIAPLESSRSVCRRVEPPRGETETTFVGNALLKARAAAARAQASRLSPMTRFVRGGTGRRSRCLFCEMGRARQGLCQSDGGGAPSPSGFAGSIDSKPGSSVLAVAWPDGEEIAFEVDGNLVWPARGTRGFGYDPIFVPEGHQLTFGEMDPAAKHAMSHRARAFAKFVEACLG